MRKIITLGIMLLFLGMTISSTTGIYLEKQSTIAPLDGNTLYVGGSGPNNYTKIQDAINDSSDGDTVYVYDDSSPYFENIVVDKSINLTGEDRNTTIIDGSEPEPDDIACVIYIWERDVTLTGFTIQNSWCGIGIDGNDFSACSDYNTIYGNVIRDNNIGIQIIGSKENNIYSNNITNNSEGITVVGLYGDSYYNNIYKNNIMNNRQGISLVNGLDGDDTRDNSIFHNNLINNFINARDSGSNNHWSNKSVGNYWDNWIGLKINLPIFQKFPKVIIGFIGINFDWNPASEPYDIGV